VVIVPDLERERQFIHLGVCEGKGSEKNILGCSSSSKKKKEECSLAGFVLRQERGKKGSGNSDVAVSLSTQKVKKAKKRTSTIQTSMPFARGERKGNLKKVKCRRIMRKQTREGKKRGMNLRQESFCNRGAVKGKKEGNQNKAVRICAATKDHSQR